jgi:endonuclease YncB( thermonuclease family)
MVDAILILTAYLVIDGDTLKADDFKVRIWGIDAPELSEPAGAASHAALVAVTDGQTLTCAPKYLDRYGRTVALCMVPSGEDIACAMVALGQAKDWPRYSGGYYAECAE